MAKFDLVFSRDLSDDSEVIGAKNPTDAQLFSQIRKEFSGTVLESIALTGVRKLSDHYEIDGTLEHDGSVEDIVHAVQREVYDSGFSAGQFSIKESAVDETAAMRP